MPLFHQPMLRTFGGDGEAIQLSAQTDGEIADVDHLLHFAERLLPDFANLPRHQFGEIGFVLSQRFAKAPHELAAHRGRDDAPTEKGFMGVPDRGGDIVSRRHGKGGEGPTVDGRVHVQHVAGARLRTAAAPHGRGVYQVQPLQQVFGLFPHDALLPELYRPPTDLLMAGRTLSHRLRHRNTWLEQLEAANGATEPVAGRSESLAGTLSRACRL
mgnify:CR=1 FL=1